MAPISTEELYLFHKFHREVFSILIFRLRRDLTQSLLVMALWIWLEHNGYPDINHMVMSLPHTLVDALFDEVVLCLKCLEEENPVIPDNGGLPLTKMLTQEDMSLRIVCDKRYTIIAGIRSVLKNICARIFTDLLQIVLRMNNNNRSCSSRCNTSNTPLTVPGFPHPLFGTFNVQPNNIVNLDLFDERIWMGTGPCDDVTDDDKSVFLTFSRGFPVSKLDVTQLFTRVYGDCVKNLSMGKPGMHDQPLFAVLTLKTVEGVDQILNGKRVAKLQINGKHIWARKYERRD